MISTGDFKKGLRIEVDDAPWTIVSLSTQSPSARGASTLIKVRLKNVLTGQVSDRAFKSGDKVGEPDLEFRGAQYLYSAPDGSETIYHFMDMASYDQFELRDDELGDVAQWLSENLEVRVGADATQFVVNGTVVFTAPKTGMAARTDGIWGVRVNHVIPGVLVENLRVSN